MKKLCLLLVFSMLNRLAIAQIGDIQEISIGQSFIWNKTTIFDTFSGARARNKTGNAWSNATNIAYTFATGKKLYASIGLGYFNQRFGVNRGFDFYEPIVGTKLFYTTKNYSYKSFNYFGGVGYRIKVNSKNDKILPINSEARVSAIVNFFNTFQQEFQHDFSENFLGNPNPQIRKNNYYYGSSGFIKAGLVRPVNRNFKIGIDLLFPVYNKLRKDEIFRENTTEYHNVDFSIGTSINLVYNFKK